jgi:hypothetical protein
MNYSKSLQYGQCAYNAILKCICITTVVVKKAMRITYSGCVLVALGIQRAKGISHNTSYVACLALLYSSSLSHKWKDFRGKKKKVTEHKMCILIFYTTFV